MSVTYLVSCVSRKAETSCAACNFYRSPWFKKARAFVESTGADWLILSAHYGLLYPWELAEPYDETLARRTAAERRAWGRFVAEAITERLPVGRLVVLAGVLYRKPLVPLLEAAGYSVSVPMAGLGIGQQMAWLKARTAERRLSAAV